MLRKENRTDAHGGDARQGLVAGVLGVVEVTPGVLVGVGVPVGGGQTAFVEAMKAFEETRRKYRNALRELAK